MADFITSASAVQLKGIANDLFCAKDYQGAASLYTKIDREFTQTATPEFLRVVKCNRAACMIGIGDFQGAIPDLEEVIQTAPKDTSTAESIALTQKAHHRLAHCFFELGKLTDAMKEMETCRAMHGGRQTQAATNLRNKIAKAILAKDGKVATELPSHTDSKVLRYEVKVVGQPVSIVKTDTVPRSLCSMYPPEMPTKTFLAQLVKKHHDAIMGEKKWTCWNCRKKAVSLVHTPMSYLHLEEPMVVDFAQPVCINGGECDKEARKMMEEEMRFATAGGGMNRV